MWVWVFTLYNTSSSFYSRVIKYYRLNERVTVTVDNLGPLNDIGLISVGGWVRGYLRGWVGAWVCMWVGGCVGMYVGGWVGAWVCMWVGGCVGMYVGGYACMYVGCGLAFLLPLDARKLLLLSLDVCLYMYVNFMCIVCRYYLESRATC